MIAMADTSSILKICPHCGQSVAVGLLRCPSCGARFESGESDFVAYERYNEPPVVYGQSSENTNLDQTAVYTAADFGGQTYQGNRYGEAGHADGMDYAADPAAAAEYPEMAYQEVSSSRKTKTMAEAASESAAARSGGEFSRGRSSRRGASSHPGAQDQEEAQRRKSGLIVTIVAAVILIAVIGAGVAMAFRLGIVGSESEETPMMEAQNLVDSSQYDAAIEKLESLVASGDATIETYQLLAEAYTRNEEADKAADAYLRGYEALSNSTLKKAAIDAYLKIGDQAKAEEDYVTSQQAYNTILNRLDSSNSSAIAGLAALAQLSDGTVTTQTTATPAPSGQAAAISPPEASGNAQQSNGNLSEGDSAVVTPTPTPVATPTPTPTQTVTSTPAPTVAPTPAPVVTATPSSEPEPSVEPSPEVSTEPSTEPSPEVSTEPSTEPSEEPSGFTPSGSTFDYGSAKYEIVSGRSTWETASWAAYDDNGSVASISSVEQFNAFCAQADAAGLSYVWVEISLESAESLGLRYANDVTEEGEDRVVMCKTPDGWYLIDVSSSAGLSNAGVIIAG